MSKIEELLAKAASIEDIEKLGKENVKGNLDNESAFTPSNVEPLISTTGFGDELILGLYYDGKIHKGVLVDKFDGDVKSELFRKEARKNPGLALTYVIAKIVRQIGPYVRDELYGSDGKSGKNPAKWLSIIRNLSVCDSEYIIYLSGLKTFIKKLNKVEKCDVCSEETEVILSISDFKTVLPDEELRLDSEGRYLLPISLPEYDFEGVLAVQNRLDAELFVANSTKNDYLDQISLFNSLVRTINDKRVTDLDNYFGKLGEDVLEDFMIALSVELPGPQRVHFIECAHEGCGNEIMVRASVADFLSSDQSTLKNSIKDRMKKKKLK